MPGLVELTEILVHDTGLWVVRVAAGGPLVGELPEVDVEISEDRGGYLRPAAVGPSPDDRVEPLGHGLRIAPAQGAQLVPKPCPDPSDSRLAELDQQLGVVAADVVSQEVEALIEEDDARLVLVERQTPRRQPGGELGLNVERVLPGVAVRDEIVGVADHSRGVHPIEPLDR